MRLGRTIKGTLIVFINLSFIKSGVYLTNTLTFDNLGYPPSIMGNKGFIMGMKPKEMVATEKVPGDCSLVITMGLLELR